MQTGREHIYHIRVTVYLPSAMKYNMIYLLLYTCRSGLKGKAFRELHIQMSVSVIQL